MITLTQSRRHFLQTLAFAGAAGVVGTYPGISYSASGDTLKVRFAGNMDSLDPGYNVGGHPDTDIIWAILPSLVHYTYSDGQLGWRPTANVESIDWRDETHIDFTLKPGFTWTNGFGEVTADDVLYSFDRMKVSEWKGYFEAYDRTEVTSKYSGTIVLNAPFAPFFVTALCAQTGTILSRKATESVGGKFTTEVPATCGPYLYEWKQDQYVRFTPNPEWAGPKPHFANIEGLFISEGESASLAYEAGEVSATQISSNAYARYKKELPANSKLTIAGALQYHWIGMNTEHPKLKDIRVRQAIQHAVDVDSILQGAYSGTAEKSYGVVCPGLVGKRQETKYSYNPEKAKTLLADAGVSGLELDLKVLNEQERMLTGQIVQANLAAVGIKVNMLPQGDGPFWDMGQESKGDVWKDLQIWTMQYSSAPDPYDPFQWFKRDQVGVWNWERWSSDEFEELYHAGIVETDSSKRNAIYLRMQEIMEDTGAYIWISHDPEVFIHRKDLLLDTSPSAEMQFRYFKES